METILDIIKLTDEELITKAAELLGAKWYYNPQAQQRERILRLPPYAPRIAGFVETAEDMPVAVGNFLGLPNYTGDLNACQAWEQTAPIEYWRILMYVTNPTYNPGTDGEGNEMYLNFYRATGRARCVAFIFWKQTSGGTNGM